MMKPCTLMIAVFLGAFCIWTPSAGSEILKLNCSDGYWYPFLYTRNDQAGGILYDIVNKAIESLNMEPMIEPVPFRRAIVRARRGEVDGVITVGFHPDLDPILDYPPGAEKDPESPWRIMQVDHVVVSGAKDEYVFKGDLKTLPPPVRLLQHSPIIEDLHKKGIDAQEVQEDIQNFLKLMRDGHGVILTTSVFAEMMNRDQRFKGRIKIHGTPVASHSCYLAFAENSSLSPAARKRIWKEIVRWRDDYIFMLQVFSQY